MQKSLFSQYAMTLLNLGYEPIPISPGRKAPVGAAGKGWQRGKIDKKRLQTWHTAYPGAGVGIRTEYTPAVDIDVYNDDLVEQILTFLYTELNCELFGYENIIARVGQPPKALLVFKTDQPFTKKFSASYEDDQGRTNRIEVLGKGQQFVALAVHPGTKSDYYYLESKIQDVPRDKLPELTHDLINKLFAFFESAVETSQPEWTKVSNHSGDSSPTAWDGDEEMTSIANLKPTLDIDQASIVTTLKQYPPGELNYDKWIEVGMSLYHQYSGDNKGFNIWNQWSRQSEKHEEGYGLQKWKSFADDGSSNPVTFATILYRVAEKTGNEVQEEQQADGYDEQPVEAGTLAGFLKRYAYVMQSGQVLDLRRPVHLCLIDFANFQRGVMNKMMEVQCPVTPTNPEGKKKVPVVKAWMSHPQRMTIEGETFQPQKGATRRVIRDKESGGRLMVNLARFPEWSTEAPEDIDDRLLPIRNHLRYLIPNQAEREWFTNWIAFNIQRPERRCKVTPLHISKTHGTGRGFVVTLLMRLIGAWNISKAQMDALCGEGSAGQYHDYLDKSLLCCIEEVRESTKRYSVSDKIRDLMTEEHLNVNLKYGGKGTRRVYTNFFWMSNHVDAVVLKPEDRRVIVLSGPDAVQSQGYYDDLYDWLEDDKNIIALWHQLMSLDLDDFNWKFAPMTAGKKRMIEYNYTDTETAFRTMLEMCQQDTPYMGFTQIKQALYQVAEEEGNEYRMDDGQLKKLLQQYTGGNVPKQYRIPGCGSRVRPWYMMAANVDSLEHHDGEIKLSLERANDLYEAEL